MTVDADCPSPPSVEVVECPLMLHLPVAKKSGGLEAAALFLSVPISRR
jgi:hypothetical protein